MSFPRTGHSLLVGLLLVYFGPGFNYCEYYTACRSRPCRRALNNFQKCHDFELNTPQPPEARYIVQIRHPWPAIVSRFNGRLAKGLVEGNLAGWEQHRRTEMRRYLGFVKRWALAGEGIQPLLLPYHQLIDRPVDSLAEIVALFDDRVDLDRVREAVRHNDVRELRRWADFPYTTEAALAEADAINLLQLPLF
jgi:hypothetical protein